MTKIDWATARGIADEPTLDRFVRGEGGVKISEIVPVIDFKNADYLFPQDNVIIELKRLETEFAKAPGFNSKVRALIEHFGKDVRLGDSPFPGKPYNPEFVQGFVKLFKPPLAHIAKKANRQIRESKKHLNLPNAHGILFCVNDEFRDLEPRFIKGLFGEILHRSYSSIDGFIYHTNHYVDLPWSEYANLIWTTMYSENAPMTLVDFVDNLGRKWFDFCEAEGLPSDQRLEGPDLNLTSGAKAIKRK